MAQQTDQPVLTIRRLADKIGATVSGEPSAPVKRVNAIEAAGPEDVTFLLDASRAKRLHNSSAAAVIVNQPLKDLTMPQLVVQDVNAALIKALQIFAPPLQTPEPGIHPSAVVAEDADIHPTAHIGPQAVIAKAVRIGSRTIIGPACIIGENTTIGQNCRLDPNVAVYHNCSIANNVIIQANTTIGSTGFGYAQIAGRPQLIPHNGGVIIEDNVEIGANCCVDRAKFGNTIIGAGTKIDNIVQIAHNVVIGKCCLIAGQAGIGGSAKLGDGVVIAGQAGVIDNVEIGPAAVIGARSAVIGDLPGGRRYAGVFAMEAPEAMRLVALYRRLPKLNQQLKDLQKRVQRLEAPENNSK